VRVLLLQTEFGSHTSVEGERVVRCEEEKSIPSSTAGVRRRCLEYPVAFGVALSKTPLIPRLMDAAQKERREREIAEVLMRFRTFAGRSKWKKARISRELGVSLSTVDRWLAGHDKILLASMLAIRRFLEKWE